MRLTRQPRSQRRGDGPVRSEVVTSRRPGRLAWARHLLTDWLYCLLQGLLSLVDIAFWLVGAIVFPLLALFLGPRLVAVLQTCVNWLASLNGRLASWRQRQSGGAPSGGSPWRRYSVWRSLRCLGINALSLPVHVVVLFLFPLTLVWAPAHGRLLGWMLLEPPAPAGSGPDRRGGHGLVGMRERVRALGGTLETGPDDQGGFRVLAVLPLDPPAEASGPVDTETAPPSPEGLDQEDV